jgi:hypothetical protein
MAATVKQLRRKIGRVVLLIGVAVCIYIIGVGLATIRTVMHLGGSSVDCAAPPPYVKRSSSDQALFTAHVFYVGRVDSEYTMRSGHRFGPWAIAYVKRHYWGLPWWDSKIVALGPGRYQEGETYFVDGRWPGNSMLLPFVYTGPCRRTRPLSEAVVDTRILRDGPPRTGARILGYTYRRKSNVSFQLAPGMRVEIRGPNGSIFVVSDADAVYDLTGVPAGHYRIQIEDPDRRNREEGDQDRDLLPGEVWERSVYFR